MPMPWHSFSDNPRALFSCAASASNAFATSHRQAAGSSAVSSRICLDHRRSPPLRRGRYENRKLRRAAGRGDGGTPVGRHRAGRPRRHITPMHRSLLAVATAGAGDSAAVAGMIAGLLAQGMDAFCAARAGTWLPRQGGRQPLVRRLLISSEDIPEELPAVIRGAL